MPQYCAVPMCTEKKRGHKFPRDEAVAKQWLVAIRRETYIPSKYARVCYKHFMPDDYAVHKEPTTDNPPPKLKPQAVPSQFTWNQKSDEKKEIKRKRALQHQINRESGKNGSNKNSCEEPYNFDDSSQELELVIDMDPQTRDIGVQCSLCKC